MHADSSAESSADEECLDRDDMDMDQDSGADDRQESGIQAFMKAIMEGKARAAQGAAETCQEEWDSVPELLEPTGYSHAEAFLMKGCTPMLELRLDDHDPEKLLGMFTPAEVKVIRLGQEHALNQGELRSVIDLVRELLADPEVTHESVEKDLHRRFQTLIQVCVCTIS